MKEQVLFDSDREISYEEYSEWRKECGEEPKEEGSDDFYSYVNNMHEMEWEDFQTNIEYSEVCYNNFWSITGSLGLWYGRKEVSCVVEGLNEAIMTCIGRCDGYLRVAKKHSVVYVSFSHHDGTNYYELRALSPIGVERLMKNEVCPSLNNRENILTLPKYLF